MKMGVIAQEIMEIFPDLVNDNNSEYLSVDYISLISLLIKAVQEQQMMINNLTKSKVQ